MNGVRHSTYAAVAAVFALMVVGVHPAAAQAGNTLGLKIWRHAVIEPKSDAGFVLMAAKHGFAEKEGLKIEILKVKADVVGLRALLANEVDSYEGGPASAIVGTAHGADIKIVGCQWPQLVHGIFVRSTINSVQDLRGKTFAISSPGAMPDTFARTVLEKNGIPASEVKFANLGGDTDRFKALVAGVVDAAVVSTEYLPSAPKDVKLLFAARDVMPEFMRVCMVTSGKLLQERRDDVVHFVAAEIAGLRYAVAHKDETLKLTRETIHPKPDDPRPAFIFDQVVKYKDLDSEMPLPMNKFKWMQDQLIKTHNINTPIDLAKLVDPSVRADALKLLGK